MADPDLFLTKLISELIEREGGFSNHPSDRGGPTMYGITEAVARAHGYKGPMHQLPIALAQEIYAQTYYYKPRFHEVAKHSQLLAEELLDTGVNMGVELPVRFLQSWLNGLQEPFNLQIDGRLGPLTLNRLRVYLNQRGKLGEQVLFMALNCSQAVRYLSLTETRERNRDFLFGWLRARVLDQIEPIDYKEP